MSKRRIRQSLSGRHGVTKEGYELSARGAQQQQAAQNERNRGRGIGPEAHGGNEVTAHQSTISQTEA
jgi:hypothetical protein